MSVPQLQPYSRGFRGGDICRGVVSFMPLQLLEWSTLLQLQVALSASRAVSNITLIKNIKLYSAIFFLVYILLSCKISLKYLEDLKPALEAEDVSNQKQNHHVLTCNLIFHHNQEYNSTTCLSFSISDVCSQPLKIGPCFGAIPRFYYNSSTGKCEMFRYGGCLGNGNNFHSAEGCRERCETS